MIVPIGDVRMIAPIHGNGPWKEILKQFWSVNALNRPIAQNGCGQDQENQEKTCDYT